MHSSLWTINGEELANTDRQPHRRSRRRKLGSATHIHSNTDVARIVTPCINHEFHFGPLCPSSQKPGGSRANSTH